MSLTDILFGGSTAQQAQREMQTYDPRLGGRQKDIGDVLGDLFTFQGNTLDRATEDAYVQDLKDNYGSALKSLKKYNLISDDEAKLTKDTSRVDLDRLIADKAEDLKINKSLNVKMATDGYIPNAGATYQEKLKGYDQYLTDKDRAKSEEFGGSRETARYNRGLQQQQNNLQMLQFQNQSAERKAQRRMDNRRIDLQEARDARKGQREMMMMIMAGLKNIGQGFY